MKRFLRRILLAVIIFSIAAPSAAAAPVELTMAAWGSQAEQETINALVEAFNRLHEDVQVTVTYPGEYEDKIVSMVAAGVAPDVIQVQNGWQLSMFVAKGIVQPLNPYLELSPIPEDLYVSPKILDELTYDGRVYALPKGWTTKVLAVNQDIFEELGLALPDETWSLEDFRRTAMRLTDPDGDRYGSMELWDLLWMYTNGGRILADDNETVLFDEPAAIIGFEFAVEMNKDPRATVQSNVWSQMSQELWYTGRVGMWPDMGAWTLPNFRTWGVTWKFVLTPLPHNTTKPGAVPMAVTGFAMTSTTQKQDAAWKFIRWAGSSYEAQSIIAAGAMIPARRDAIEQWLVHDWPGAESFLVELNYAAPEPRHPLMDQIYRIMYEAWSKVRAGELSAAAAHQDAARQMRALISQAKEQW